MIQIFKNEYGSLKVLIGIKQPISDLCSADFPESIFFDMETAEKIALITENRKIQIGFRKVEKDYKSYLVYHFSSSEVGLCSIEDLNFSSSVTPSIEIERLRRPVIL